MIRMFACALALCVSLPLTSSFAATAALGPTTPAPAAPQASHLTISGSISSIDLQQRSFVLDMRGGRQVTVRVNQNTRITVGGNASTLANLTAGQRARVTGRYDSVQMVLNAQSVVARN